MNNNNIIPGLQLMCLTADEDDYNYQQEEQEPDIYWLDDYECQENLGTILALGTEECVIDDDNHIQSLNGIKLFFEELGVITEEPEPIDPNYDYEEEGRLFLQERNKHRKFHIDSIPSLLSSAVSSTVSSFQEEEQDIPTSKHQDPSKQDPSNPNTTIYLSIL